VCSGGSDNAYTDNENTNFYFDINAAQLHGALDRFSQFFIAPLLTEGATGREMKAVDAEHSKNKQNDEWRETQLLQSFGYEGHPFHKFGTGSLKTLGNVPHAEMRELYVCPIYHAPPLPSSPSACAHGSEPVWLCSLFKFYNHWYHASNMRLVVLGKEKLSVLEDWVCRVLLRPCAVCCALLSVCRCLTCGVAWWLGGAVPNDRCAGSSLMCRVRRRVGSTLRRN
jgi:insulysin